MKIQLHNFFKFYDSKNINHVAAVSELFKILSEKSPELLEDNSNWVRIYRNGVSATPNSQGIFLNVPWYPQTDNYTLPDSTCNSSCSAMCLEFLKPGSLPAGPKGDDAYLRKVLAVGKSIDHGVQTRVLQSYGVKSQFRYDLSFADLDKELSAGRPVVLGILHRGPTSNPTRNTGHMIVCIGKNDKGDYIINDPYGSLHDGYTKAVINGKGVVYSRAELSKRWTADGTKSGWGRIFS
jgi:hypothetical protein